MAWRIEFDPAAAKELAKLDKPVARRITAFLGQCVATLADPRSLGEALRGDELGQFWKYRLGDYRIIARIVDKRVVIVVLRIGHRGDVYSR
ncbi:MAG TPA: type II toxin-antitoxin system RelE/ParE family toxin [Caldimonas sp.]|nr:type II toxin-antitoxin system RelE/ParE family toxin [Caldimonas sp.]